MTDSSDYTKDYTYLFIQCFSFYSVSGFVCEESKLAERNPVRIKRFLKAADTKILM